MRPLIMSLAVAGLSWAWVNPVLAQVSTRTYKVGKQKITNFEPALPPTVVPGVKIPNASAKAVVLKSTDWTCGTYFKDDSGRDWRRVWGHRVDGKPEVVSGWLLRTKHGYTFFFTAEGALFTYWPPENPIPRTPPQRALPPQIPRIPVPQLPIPNGQ